MQPPSPHPEEYDVVVLGSGEAGKYIAWTLAKKGMLEGLIPLFSAVPPKAS